MGLLASNFGIINEVVDRKQVWHKILESYKIDGSTVNNYSDIANAFNKYFASIGSVMASELPDVDG